MKKVILFFTVICACFSVQAQKETYNWVFGSNVMLTWNTTRSYAVTPIAGGAVGTSLDGLPTSPKITSMNTREGCFTLSDSDGNLLFYSDGIKVWDKDGIQMPNGSGLLGDSSSSQSGIIFPYPNDANKYVAVTLGANEINPHTIGYSVIDMSMRAGAGDVIPTQKNLSFPNMPPTSTYSFSEAVTSIIIPGSSDYWVVAGAKGSSSAIYAWRFGSSGPVSTPVVSPFPIATTGSNIGYLKISPDGKHFVWATTGAGLIYGDFDVTTGAFSNIKRISGTYYGIEFSPSQKVLYVTTSNSLIAYNADELFSQPTSATVTTKTFGIGCYYPAIQLGPDKRIYITADTSAAYGLITQIFVMTDPDNMTSPQIFKTATDFFYPGSYTKLGLPSFAANWFKMKPTAKKFACTGYDYKFTTKVDMSGGANAPVKLSLNYGDGNTGTITLVAGQTDYTIAHTYNTAGTYTVTITPVKSDNSTLSPSTVSAEAVDCTIRTNRMIRVDLQNLNTATGAQP